MRDPDQFDQFYKDVRTRLLLLTYCLTGDLPSARAAVRDTFVVTWHHWRKVSRLEDPEAWARMRACSHAQRRHTAKLWHREKGLDPEVKATLDALGKLSVTERKVLLLTQLTTASLEEISREVGKPRHETERELQIATSQFAVHRDVPTTSIRSIFEPVRVHVETVRWPRPTIVRRAGATRRRTHTVIGVAATVATLVVTGTLLTDTTGVRPSLADERVGTLGSAGPATPEPVVVSADAMLDVTQVADHLPGAGWRLVDTNDNAASDGLAMECQTERYADPRVESAQVSSYVTRERARASAPTADAVQTTEASRNLRAAKRGYTTMRDWFAGCEQDRAQLLRTHRVDGVGDQATLFELRTWDQPASTVIAGVARTGQFTTAVVSTTTGGRAPSASDVAALLAAGVSSLCEAPEAGACLTGTRLADIDPIPVADAPAMLAEVDLPPVTRVDRPWVGTEPVRAVRNTAATSCDAADFSAAAMSNNLTRTFLIPGARLPAEFGLTETIGSLRGARAPAFVDDVRRKLATCADKSIGTEVQQLANEEGPGRDLTVWHVRTEISDDATVSFLMGIVRDGTSIAQVGFVPAPSVAMSRDAFQALVVRAQERLSAMPPPKKP